VEQRQLWNVASWIVPAQLLLLLCIGHCAGLLSYFGLPDVRRLALALATASVLMTLVWMATEGRSAPPRSVMVTDLLLSFVVLGGLRLSLRRVREVLLDRPKNGNGHATRIGIIGAGDTGAALAAELLAKGRHDLRVV